jgi:hypothetical protein
MAGFVLCGTRKEESHSVISTIQNFFRNSLDFYDHNKLCASRENIPLLEKAMAEWASLYIQGWSKVLPESSIALGWNSYIRNYGSTGYMVKEAALAMKRLECQTNSSTAANSRPIGTETAAVSFLIIDSDPTGAEVWLNGQKRQHLSPTGYNVQVGKRLHVELRKDNYYPWQKDIDVNWYAKKVFRAKLKPIGNGSDRVEG